MDDNFFIKQLETVLAQFNELKSKSEYPDTDISDIPLSDIYRVITLARAAIERIAGHGSAYMRQVEDVLKRPGDFDGERLINLAGIVESLKLDIESGYLKTLSELIHGEVFGDFIEMAAYLNQEKYKDAAAVIAGSTLEAHIRQLCQKAGIDTELKTSKGIHPKKADQMNSELSGTNVYSKLDQKNVTAWLDLRNKAAHGQYQEYTADQVSLMIDGIRNFITRVPA